MPRLYKVPLILSSQPDGGYTVTSPALPELVTEGDTAREAIDNVADALRAVMEIYEDLDRTFPEDLHPDPLAGPIRFEHLVLEV